MAWLVDMYNYYDPGKGDINRAFARLFGTPPQATPNQQPHKRHQRKQLEAAPAPNQAPPGIFPNLDKEWQDGLKTVAAIAGCGFIGYSIVKRAAALTFTATVIACAYAVARHPEYRTSDIRQNLVCLFDDTSQKIAVKIGPYLHRVQEDSSSIDLSGRVRQLWNSWFP